jgi:hypothetical protein
MTKQTYWLSDPEGTRAPVEGADVRDHLVRTQGWTESTEPQGHDFVWLRHEDPTLGPARMTWEAAQLDAWSGRGWTPGHPLAVDTAAESAPNSSPKSGTAGDKKVSD